MWIPDVAARGMRVLPADVLEPVFRIRLERPGPQGALVPVERFFAAETYPLAREALLSHVPGLRRLRATPGYFVTEQSAQRIAHTAGCRARRGGGRLELLPAHLPRRVAGRGRRPDRPHRGWAVGVTGRA